MKKKERNERGANTVDKSDEAVFFHMSTSTVLITRKPTGDRLRLCTPVELACALFRQLSQLN